MMPPSLLHTSATDGGMDAPMTCPIAYQTIGRESRHAGALSRLPAVLS